MNTQEMKELLEEALYFVLENNDHLMENVRITDGREAGYLTTDETVEVQVDGKVFLLTVQQVR